MSQMSLAYTNLSFSSFILSPNANFQMDTFLTLKDPTSLPSLWLAKTMRLLGSDVEAMVSSGTSRNVSKRNILDTNCHI